LLLLSPPLMMSEELEDNSYLHGWVEILHRLDDLPEPNNISELTPDQYVQVGSNLPLCEYFSPIDIYHHFKEVDDLEFGIPRGFRAYDIVNLCSDELAKIATMVFIPRERMNELGYAGAHIQHVNELPLMMITRSNIFDSFYLNTR